MSIIHLLAALLSLICILYIPVNGTIVEVGNKCSYFFDERIPHEQHGLVNCSWYATSACCKRTEVTSVFSNMFSLYEATTTCKNQMNYLMCYFCSPDQFRWYKKELTVCVDFCDSIYDECKMASYNGNIIRDNYSNGTGFCEAQNFNVVDGSNCFKFDPNVFSASDTIGASCLAVLLFVYLML